ncbi:MAG: ABC transporter substrate binding protein [Gallionella sp.]|nr:ABC transporter substrate binding protein [Gallionella sp.]
MLSDTGAAYTAFDSALRKSLAGIAQFTTHDVAADTSWTSDAADLIIAVGMKATEAALGRTDVPVLAVMVPKAGYEALLGRGSSQQRLKPTSAIYINQPWLRQIDFIRVVLPRRSKIGVLYSPVVVQRELDDMRAAATARGMKLHTHQVSSPESLFATLDTLLNDDEVLLAIPDSAIYNPGNMRNILLSSYRARIPLVGISQAYVTAGALGAVYSSPEQLAHQSAGMVRSFAKSGDLPGVRYPEDFSVAVNLQVARSLGIGLASQEEIRTRMIEYGEGMR